MDKGVSFDDPLPGYGMADGYARWLVGWTYLDGTASMSLKGAGAGSRDTSAALAWVQGFLVAFETFEPCPLDLSGCDTSAALAWVQGFLVAFETFEPCPLDLSGCGHVKDQHVTVMIIHATAGHSHIHATAGHSRIHAISVSSIPHS